MPVTTCLEDSTVARLRAGTGDPEVDQLLSEVNALLKLRPDATEILADVYEPAFNKLPWYRRIGFFWCLPKAEPAWRLYKHLSGSEWQIILLPTTPKHGFFDTSKDTLIGYLLGFVTGVAEGLRQRTAALEKETSVG